MLANEEEARERWCYLTIAANISKCLASDCMAWRWAEYTPRVYESYNSEGAVIEEKPEQRRGYCGIAGLPKF